MGNVFEFGWEPELIIWLQSHIGSFGEKIASFFSVFGEEMILILLICFLYYWYDKEVGKFAARRIVLASMFYSQIKSVVCRLRPYFVHEEIRCLRIVEPGYDIYDISAQGYSFPSGHSSNAAAALLSTAAAVKKKWVTVIAILLTFLVGLSRVFVGVHYPTDVLAGWACGVIALFLVSFLERFLKKWQLYLIFVIVSVPGAFFINNTDYFTNLGLLFGFLLADFFETRYVNFENTKSVVRGILRILGGVLIYLVFNTLLKLPFSAEFLESGTRLSLLVRAARYTIVIFLAFGIYPMLFKYTAKIGK